MEILHSDIYTINKQYILTIIDKFSKFAAAYTLPARNSLSIIKSLKHYISLHGIPQNLITDQGSEFTSTLFHDFCKQFGIKHSTTSYQQTSSNAPVERLHSTLTETYRIVYEKNRSNDPEDILNEVILTYNNSIHFTTKHTPYELFYGRTYKFNNSITSSNSHEYLEKLRKFQSKLYPEIKQLLEDQVKKRCEKLNSTREDPENYNVGSVVYRKECRRNKLNRRFSKHKVKEDNHVTIISDKNQKIHKSKLKKKRKFQANTNDTRTGTGHTGPDEYQFD